MNKIAHGIVLVFFAIACWLVWAILQLPRMVRLRGVNLPEPAFTQFCVSTGPIVVSVLAALAAVYCIWIWLTKPEKAPSWLGFFAATMGALVMVTFPTVIAAYLPLITALNHLGTQ
jgi:hypothetical protein